MQERPPSLGFNAPNIATSYALGRQEHRARTQRGESGGLRNPRAEASDRASGFALRAAPNYEISRQDSADLAAFAREVGPLTVQTIASGDDLSEYPYRSPNGSPPATEPTVARNLLQLIGAAFGKRVLLVQPRANTTCSAATKPDRANTILINTRNGEPLLALIGHEFGHKLRAQRPDLYRAFSRLALATNPVPLTYRAQKIAQLYPANRIADEWVNDTTAARFDDRRSHRDANRIARW